MPSWGNKKCNNIYCEIEISSSSFPEKVPELVRISPVEVRVVLICSSFSWSEHYFCNLIIVKEIMLLIISYLQPHLPIRTVLSGNFYQISPNGLSAGDWPSGDITVEYCTFYADYLLYLLMDEKTQKRLNWTRCALFIEFFQLSM